MNINEIIRTQNNVQLVVNAADLKEAILEWAREMQAKIKEAMPDETLDVSEVKKKLGVSPQTLWRWQKSGYLVPFKIGRERYYRKSDIDKILNGEKH